MVNKTISISFMIEKLITIHFCFLENNDFRHKYINIQNIYKYGSMMRKIILPIFLFSYWNLKKHKKNNNNCKLVTIIKDYQKNVKLLIKNISIIMSLILLGIYKVYYINI